MKPSLKNLLFLNIICFLPLAATMGSEKISGSELLITEKDSIQSVISEEEMKKDWRTGDTPQTKSVPFDTLKNNMKKKSLKDNLVQLLQSAIFRDTTRIGRPLSEDIINREKDFRPFAGKKIVNIYINQVPVFGGSVYDSLQRHMNDVEKFGNSMHTNTKNRIILNNLLFTVGDTIQPFRLADNERILRSLPYIRDARIVVIPHDSQNQVDIGIITRDVFSIGMSINPRNTDDISLSVFDRNLLGYGWEFRNTFRYRSDVDPSLGYEGKFDIRNIAGSFISGSVNYKNAFDMKQFWINISKVYLTQETKYAGGIDFLQTSQYDENNNYNIVLYKSRIQDYWLGRSFLIGDIEDRRSIKIGARYYKTLYDKRPFTSADSNVVYHNTELYLGRLVLSQIKYYTSSLILGFGSTEDIPIGYSLELTGGLSEGEFKDRIYMGFEVATASWIEDFGFLGSNSKLGSYRNGKQWEDGVLDLSMLYFSPLIKMGRYRLRQFITGNYTRGVNRFDKRKIGIEDEKGIRGLSHESLFGSERLVFNSETMAFAPWSIWDFRFAFFAFIDAGWIGKTDNAFAQHDFFAGIGLGCRIRNEGLVFQTFNLRFAYYPSVPESISHLDFDFSTTDPVLFSQFRRGKPRIIPFE